MYIHSLAIAHVVQDLDLEIKARLYSHAKWLVYYDKNYKFLGIEFNSATKVRKQGIRFGMREHSGMR